MSETPSGRKQRKKTLSVKAKEYCVVQDDLKKLGIEDGNSSDVYADSSSSEMLSEESPSDDSDEHEVEEEEDDDDEVTSLDLDIMTPKLLLPNKISSRKITDKITKTVRTAQSYKIKSEDYFYNHSLKKSQTSNHTLDKLKKPRLSQEELQKLLTNLTISEDHGGDITQIYEQNKKFFNKWLCLLHEGFNILLYGLGSKRSILHDFHKEYLNKMPVIVINGFFPSLTMKEIIESIMIEILEIDDVPSNIFEASDRIAQEFQCYPNLHLYLIIHNIEGEMLRSNLKNQSVLANLAAINNIHLIASIDHINAPLIWDQNKLSKFNFTWWDITSFIPYREETSFETSMMITKTGSLALSSLRNVFLSLTSNSKGIYLIIAKYQLQNTGQFYQGMKILE